MFGLGERQAALGAECFVGSNVEVQKAVEQSNSTAVTNASQGAVK